MSLESDRDAVLELTQKLLVAITSGDWDTYTELCDDSLTCFEPEALGNLVDGLEFHNYYFNLPSNGLSTPVQSTIVDGKPVSSSMEETRVWHRQQGRWKHVHFHRSPAR